MTDFLQVKNLFLECKTPQEKYQKIIELGQKLPSFSPDKKIEKNLVKGCQSIVYLDTEVRDGLLFFSATSDALISKGLVALLILAYSGKSGEFVLQNKPLFLEELEINRSLSPGRSNGVASIYLAMQQNALKFLVSKV